MLFNKEMYNFSFFLTSPQIIKAKFRYLHIMHASLMHCVNDSAYSICTAVLFAVTLFFTQKFHAYYLEEIYFFLMTEALSRKYCHFMVNNRHFLQI